jgi:RecA/RadA recombinase
MARKAAPKKVKEPVQERTEFGLLRGVIDDAEANKTFSAFAQRQTMYETFDLEDIADTVYVRSGCLPFDLITGGRGLPLGRFMQLYSEPGAGKTTLLFAAARGLCNNGLKVLYLDAESSDDTAEQMGLIGKNLKVPAGSFKYLSISSYEDLEKVTDAFTQSSFDLCILDSLTAVGMSKASRKKTGKTIEEATAIGIDARIQSLFVKNFYCDIKEGRQSFIYITQTRTKIDFKNPMNNGPAAAGCIASKFFSNIQVQAKPSSYVKDGVKVVGRYLYLVAEKNRHASPLVRIPSVVYFGKGIDNIDMLIRLGFMLGIFSSGAWPVISLPGQEPVKVQGRPGLESWVRENYTAMVQVFYENAPALLEYFAHGEKVVGSSSTPLPGAAPGYSQEEYDQGIEVPDDDLSDDEMQDILSDGSEVLNLD